MSYTRSFSRDISIPYSGYVTTDKGQVHYSGTVHETVHVNVHVNTDPFDSSVNACSGQVGALTTSVVATKAAHAESIKNSSKKISQTIISGFFKTVRSELGQQIAQLKSQTEATLLHLNQLAQRCRDKHRQMEADYNRITDRYTKVFSDLNRELEVRVFELDKAAFKTRETTTECTNRSTSSDLIGVAAVSAGENARVQSSILASVTKKRALDAIHRANDFLLCQQESRNVVNQALHDKDTDSRYFVPVCLAEEVDDTTHTPGKATLYKPEVVPNSSRRRMTSELLKARWHAMPQKDADLVKKDFARCVARSITSDSPHDRRVKEYLNKFINNPLQSL
ncbi:MAG: hypothetical protein NC338_01305 [Firmicutes bacterium]|nr:hypothetical protein [Bacillota bacterium]MCM1401027.1 hypothetical protein [Bacteroides sp.]MCM1476946.1 hypothetical protein [Bacteroides sp.]